eukprot:1185844-Prorocentrum_minimum.AAC.6
MRVRVPRAWVAKARVVVPMVRGTFEAAAWRNRAAARRAIPRDAILTAGAVCASGSIPVLQICEQESDSTATIRHHVFIVIVRHRALSCQIIVRSVASTPLSGWQSSLASPAQGASSGMQDGKRCSMIR